MARHPSHPTTVPSEAWSSATTTLSDARDHTSDAGDRADYDHFPRLLLLHVGVHCTAAMVPARRGPSGQGKKNAQHRERPYPTWLPYPAWLLYPSQPLWHSHSIHVRVEHLSPHTGGDLVRRLQLAQDACFGQQQDISMLYAHRPLLESCSCKTHASHETPRTLMWCNSGGIGEA